MTQRCASASVQVVQVKNRIVGGYYRALLLQDGFMSRITGRAALQNANGVSAVTASLGRWFQTLTALGNKL